MRPVVDRLDAYQRRHRWVGFPLAVVYKFGEDQGPYLAALITYYGFLALFPLLLLLASVLGFFLQSDPGLQARILDSTLGQFPIIGDQLGDPQGLRGSGIALVVGGLLALYGSSGVAQAVQNAMNVTWAVPRHRRPNPIKARFRSLVIILIAGIAVLGTTVLSALGGSAASFGMQLGPWSAVLAVAASLALNIIVFTAVFHVSTARSTPIRVLFPGAVAASLVWQFLQLFGTAYVGNVVRDADPAYGVFALVLGLMIWIYLAAVGIVLGAEINVVRAKRLSPRALMTPFTDDVDLTSADRQVYSDAAAAQAFKGFESISVSFDHDGQHASARRARRAAPPDGTDQAPES